MIGLRQQTSIPSAYTSTLCRQSYKRTEAE